MTLIADTLRTIAEYSHNDHAGFIRAIQEAQAEQQTSDITKKKNGLQRRRNVLKNLKS